MAKKDESSKQLATLMQSSVGTDVSVSMDDVVNVFVSQYETKLHERKNELSQQMRDAKKELEDFVKAVIDAIFPKYEKYTTENEVIGVRSYISKDVDICWTDEKKGPHAKMSLVIEDMDEDGKD
jgi:predicted transcriptional regulator